MGIPLEKVILCCWWIIYRTRLKIAHFVKAGSVIFNRGYYIGRDDIIFEKFSDILVGYSL
ncbi:MAG TPA: hypothetical protein DEH25_17050 [Chloroflexi bacterium]|nr:hypothetical protein [Chloroflexota bacterium]